MRIVCAYLQRHMYASDTCARLRVSLQQLYFTKQRGWAGTRGCDILALLPGCQHIQLNLIFHFCSSCEK